MRMSASRRSGPQVVEFAKPDTQETYYLSYRTPVGFDANIDGRALNVLSIHRYKGDGSATLTYLVARLGDGGVYSDPVNGITVTELGHDSNHVNVSVRFTSPCLSAGPSVNVSPQTQNAGAGTSLSYSVSVTNADSAACSASIFGLSGTVPSGWSGAVSPASLTLAPGGTGQATLSVSSPIGAVAGTYAAAVQTDDTSNAAHAASAAVAYAVVNVDTSAPSAPSGLTATANSKIKQVQLAWQAAADNVGVAGYRVFRNGSVVATTVTVSWVDQTWKAGATYTYSVVAYDAAGNVSPASNKATVTLSGAKR